MIRPQSALIRHRVVSGSSIRLNLIEQGDSAGSSRRRPDVLKVIHAHCIDRFGGIEHRGRTAVDADDDRPDFRRHGEHQRASAATPHATADRVFGWRASQRRRVVRADYHETPRLGHHRRPAACARDNWRIYLVRSQTLMDCSSPVTVSKSIGQPSLIPRSTYPPPRVAAQDAT